MSVYEDALDVATEAEAEDIRVRNGVTWIGNGHMEAIRDHCSIAVNAIRDAGLLREDDATPTS